MLFSLYADAIRSFSVENPPSVSVDVKGLYSFEDLPTMAMFAKYGGYENDWMAAFEMKGAGPTPPASA